MDNEKMKKAVVLLVLFAHALIGFSQTTNEPVLKWGAVVIEDSINFNNDSFISVGEPDYLPINAKYKVLNWQITLNDISYAGKGNVLSKNTMNVIRNELQNRATIDIKLKVDYQNTSGVASIEKLFKVHSKNYLSNSDEYRNIWNNSKIIVIDKAQNTSAIFDESNPFSLVSLIRQNYIKNALPMSVLTAERLLAQGINLQLGILGEELDRPLIESDSLNANYGFEKIRDGIYVYPPREEYYFEVRDIDRIILFLKDNKKKNGLTINSISHVAFCKKFGDNDKYDVVLSFPFHSNLLDLGIIALQESNISNADRLIKLQNDLADSTKVNYAVGGLEILTERNREIHFEAKELGLRPLLLFDYDPNIFSAEAIHNMNSFKYQANPTIFNSFNGCFQSLDYDSIISDLPLVDMFGEDSVVQNNDGTNSTVYPIEYKINSIKLNTIFKNNHQHPMKVVLKYALQLNRQDKLVFKPIEAIYCAMNDSNKEWLVFASIDLGTLEEENYSFLAEQKIEWINLINLLGNEMKKENVIHLQNQKEKGKLKQEINIDF